MAENAGLDAELDKAVPAEGAAAFLLAVNGVQPGRVYPLQRNTIILGRSDTADIRISHPSVSSEHARLINGSLGFEVEDLGSTNGTYVGNDRVTRARLHSGDRLTLGTVEFSFLVDRAQDATVALLPPGARSLPGRMLAPVIVGPAHRYHSGDNGPVARDPDAGPSLNELVRKVITGYRFFRPYVPTMFGLAFAGIVAGLGSAVLLPPAPAAVAEARLHPAKKSNPVENVWRPQEEGAVAFFAQAERAFTHPALVGASLQKLEGGEPAPERVMGLQERMRLELIGDRLYRATYQEPLLGRGQPPPVEFLEAHIKNYKDSEIEKALQAFREEADFLKSKWEAAQGDLQKINVQLAEFKKQNSDGLPETALQANASRFQLDSRRGELRARLARLEGEVAADERQISADSPIAQSRFQASQVYRDSLATLQRKLSEARAQGFGDQHPEVMKIKVDIEGVEKLIAQEMSSTTNEKDRSANAGWAGLVVRRDMSKASLDSARRELREVEKSLSSLNKLVVSMPEVAAKLDDLQRSYESTKKLHDQLLEQYQRANLQIDIERVNARSRFEVVTPPYLQAPTSARTFGLRAGMGMFVGLMIVGLIIVLREGRKLFSRALADLDATGGAG